MIELFSVNKYFVITSLTFTKRAKKIKEAAREVKNTRERSSLKYELLLRFEKGVVTQALASPQSAPSRSVISGILVTFNTQINLLRLIESSLKRLIFKLFSS